MNVEQLLTHFDRITDAPDAIPRLRRFILDLAVRGKLVPQDPNDEPASKLLKRIPSEKTRLGKARETLKDEILFTARIDKIPFRIPGKWFWVRFGNIANFSAGRTPPRNELSFWNTGDYPWISIADMNDGETLTATKETVSKESAKQIFRSDPQQVGTMIMSFKLTIGKVARLGIPAYHNEAIISIRPYVAELDPYLFKVLPFFAQQSQTKGAIKGATLNRESLSNLLVALPPLAEQHRIVAKVDELMALCDRLEAARRKREAKRDRMAIANLARLNTPAPDTATFRNQAAFALNNLTPLTTRPDQIKALRQTVLNLAVRGKLVPQDPNDEPASELLKRIAMIRNDLVERKTIRRGTPIASIDEDEPPFEIPNGWEWSRIGDAVLFTEYGTSRKSSPSEPGVPVLTMGNIHDGMIVWGNEKTIPYTAEELPALYLKQFDLLYNRTNSAELVGKTGIYLGEGDCRTFASYLIRVRVSREHFSPHFLNLTMNTPEFRETQIVPLIKKQTGQANVNGTSLKHMLIPVPPLAEQHRIVAKVDELMALCDQLEASLATGEKTLGQLVESTLHQALTPERSLLRM